MQHESLMSSPGAKYSITLLSSHTELYRHFGGALYKSLQEGSAPDEINLVLQDDDVLQTHNLHSS